ncbi:lysozyme [Vibrio spartinae]|uniref:Lysozyme n=1 Tax=Vibrio spartinae TaxID=1918945 RepID=A0A1N6MAJ8_9VIBR|nr:lysozyme [Vibrio spartinae]QMV16664.1 Lysozyme RrrD [Vibrio spartinae]SIO96488.1 Lysozyme RrrD [Vibrio spartinae]
MKYNRLIGTVLFGAVAVTGTFEGQRNEAYQDPGGVWTVCFGETAGVRQDMSYSDQQCAMMLASSLNYHNQPLENLHYQLPPNVHIAALDFSYNLGTNALRRSTLYRKLKQQDIAGACLEFNRWVYLNGKDCRVTGNRCRGIVTRREIETQLCLGQISVRDALIQLGHTPSDSEVMYDL